MIELYLDIDQVEYLNETAYSGTLIVSGYMTSDSMTTEFHGSVRTDSWNWFEPEGACLIVYGHDGEEIACLENVDWTEYIDEEQLQDEAIATL